METPPIYRPVLFDLGPLSAAQTDQALEAIYKAQSDEPPEQADIWEPHHSPFVRELIERFTRHGLDRIEAVRAELAAWESGARHIHSRSNVPRPSLHPRWTDDELALVRLYLETLPPGEWGMDDWLLASEAAFQQYLPPDFAWTEADWLAKRAVLMGRLQARLPDIAEAMAQAALDAEVIPSPKEAATQAAIEYGRARAAENIVQLSDGLRHRIRKVIINHAEEQVLGTHQGSLQSQLLDEFGAANRDWRRIGVTEAGEMRNQGLVAAQPPGQVLRRYEQYRGACAFCAKIHGKEMTVVPPDKPNKNGETEIWVGKTNIGRSAAPRKRVGSMLIAREPRELWWVAAGVIHPNCRGGWDVMMPVKSSGDPEFDAWVKAMLSTVKR